MTADTQIQVTVLLFSRLKYALEQSELSLLLPEGATTDDVAEHVRGLLDEPMVDLPFRMAVNQVYTPRITALNNGDEVALIPPVQGG